METSTEKYRTSFFSKRSQPRSVKQQRTSLFILWRKWCTTTMVDFSDLASAESKLITRFISVKGPSEDAKNYHSLCNMCLRITEPHGTVDYNSHCATHDWIKNICKQDCKVSAAAAVTTGVSACKSCKRCYILLQNWSCACIGTYRGCSLIFGANPFCVWRTDRSSRRAGFRLHSLRWKIILFWLIDSNNLGTERFT